MPPQIPDEDEVTQSSENEVEPEPQRPQRVEIKGEKKGKAKAEDQDESLMVESESALEDDNSDDLDEEEYVVEKITNHSVGDDGIILFEVKWEGYEKKTDRTWEPEENLQSAPKPLEDYLEGIGGKEAILRQWKEGKSGKKGKKRGRSSTGVDTSMNGSKRGRKSKLEHPYDSTPPASSSHDFTPPTGNWEEEVLDIDACQGTDGKPIVYLTWKNGHKSQHPLPQIYKRCPQKMLQFYERHLVFKRGDEL